MSLPESDEDLLAAISQAFSDVFLDLDVEITKHTSSNDIEAWDSLAHIQLVMAVEKQLGIQFDAAEIGQIVNVRSIIELVRKK